MCNLHQLRLLRRKLFTLIINQEDLISVKQLSLVDVQLLLVVDVGGQGEVGAPVVHKSVDTEIQKQIDVAAKSSDRSMLI